MSLARMEWDGMRFHCTAQNSVHFKPYELFTSRFSISYFRTAVVCVVTYHDTTESETADGGTGAAVIRYQLLLQ